MNVEFAKSPLRHRQQMRQVHSPIDNTTPIRNPFGFPSTSSKTTPPLLLSFTHKDISVDYDENVTGLYEHIGNSNWEAATKRCEQYPTEAATWIVRYQRDAHGNKINTTTNSSEVIWRFLPIHSACALNPPISFLQTLLKAYTNSSRTLDDQGMLPLHYACGAKCTREVLYLLLMSFPQAALKEDPNGMLPLHYLAQWGPCEEGVIDMVCVATGYKVGTCKDGDGNTCEDLARSAEYSGNIDVANKIREFAIMYSSQNGSNGEDVLSQQRVQQPYPNNNNNVLSIKTSTTTPSRDKYSSFEDADAELIDDTTLIEHEPEGDIEISLSTDVGSPLPIKHGYGNSSDRYYSNTSLNNENNQWNNHQMTPRSGRHAMMKLGVSPVNNNNTSRGLNNNHSNPSPQANSTRAFSWNQNSPMSNNDDDTSVEALFQNEARENRGLSNIGTPNNNGGRRRRTSSIGLPPPSPRYVTTTPTNRNRRSRSQQRQHELQSDMSNRESRNQRLSELRDELSSLRREESHREGAPGVSGASTYSRSTQSSTSYGTQLNQQLQVLVKAEEQDPLAISSSHFESFSQNELALKEEVNRLKAEKSRAEAALAKATMPTPTMLSTIQSEDSRDDEEDDGVSKLTFLEHDDCNGQLKGVVSLKSNKINSGNTLKLQQTKTVEELMDIIAKEKAKSADLEKQVKVLKDENESSIKSHGETVKNQLQDMKSLCKSLHKAKLEIDNSKNKQQKASDDLEEMRQKLEASEARVKELEKANEYKEQDVDEQSSSEQVRTLKKKIEKLQQSDDDNTQKLWEANKLHKRAMQDKEDEYTETIRDLKIKHEKILIEKEDEYLQEIRDVKKKTEQSFEEREASYIKQLRDIKKKEQTWTDREDELLKQMNAEKLTSSFSELEIDNLMQQKEDDFKKSIQKAIDEKDEEFEKEVSKLKEEIERLKEEQVDANDDKAAVQEVKAQLKECKKELKQQLRKHKSEMAKIQNTMEMQKSKVGRLQSHIQSLEKQITDMVNDYESRLQDAFYG